MARKTADKLKSRASMRPAKVGDKTAIPHIDTFRSCLLHWYDRHRRTLPWRATTPKSANPYHVWLSEIMLQQTVVAAVIPYFLKFVDKWPTVHDLANADQNDVMQAWAGLGYYARARNLHKCAQVVSQEKGGLFPACEKTLKTLPGIGEYTSAAIAAIAFDQPAIVIDGNVERVIARYYAISEPLPGSKPVIRLHAGGLSEGRGDRPGDFAQAMMDLGATVCTPKSPKCMLCPVSEGCKAYEGNIQQDLPRKREKPEKPKKYGYVYWLRNEKGEILVERRPESGLLGGMIGLPTSEWIETQSARTHPAIISGYHNPLGKADWQVRHVFTHFSLLLDGFTVTARAKEISENERIFWIAEKDILDCGLPTVFKKFAKLMILDDRHKG